MVGSVVASSSSELCQLELDSWPSPPPPPTPVTCDVWPWGEGEGEGEGVICVNYEGGRSHMKCTEPYNILAGMPTST